MAPLMRQALPKNEALCALARAVGNRYRATGDEHHVILIHASAADGVVVLTAYYGRDSESLSVLTPIGIQGWNVYVETQLLHEAITVTKKRIDLERFALEYVDSRTRRDADAYR